MIGVLFDKRAMVAGNRSGLAGNEQAEEGAH
jgi:hypothetical protein